MVVSSYLACRGNGSQEIGGWMRERKRNILLSHVLEALNVLKSFWREVRVEKSEK